MTTLAVPYDAFADKITAAVPRGKGPDIFIYAQDRLGGWIEAGNTVEPIDFFLDKATKDRFIPTTMEAMTYRGTVYGLPLNYKVITLIYNKKLVPTPPEDLEGARRDREEADRREVGPLRARLLLLRLLLPRRRCRTASAGGSSTRDRSRS